MEFGCWPRGIHRESRIPLLHLETRFRDSDILPKVKVACRRSAEMYDCRPNKQPILILLTPLHCTRPACSIFAACQRDHHPGLVVPYRMPLFRSSRSPSLCPAVRSSGSLPLPIGPHFCGSRKTGGDRCGPWNSTKSSRTACVAGMTALDSTRCSHKPSTNQSRCQTPV